MTHILLGQLGANGDCLYATILARQIRHDYPSAHLTWAISSQCVGLLRNNPYVDEVWEIPIASWDQHEIMWRVFEREAVRRLLRREFDHAVLSQIWPSNFQNYDGTVRPSILRAYGKPITVPIENVIYLTPEEEAEVDEFASATGLKSFEHRILFECSSKSGQSFMTPELAQAIAEQVYAELAGATIVFSTNMPMRLRHRNSRYAGSLSLRQTAKITQDCTLFVGCGSGGTVAATSTAAKQLPMITLLKEGTSVFASFAHDFEYFGLPRDHMLESTETDPAQIAAFIITACRHGIGTAKARFETGIPLRFELYFEHLAGALINRQRFLDAAQSLLHTGRRYAWRPELVAFGWKHIVPKLSADPGWLFAHRRRAGEAFVEELASAGATQSAAAQ